MSPGEAVWPALVVVWPALLAGVGVLGAGVAGRDVRGCAVWKWWRGLRGRDRYPGRHRREGRHRGERPVVVVPVPPAGQVEPVPVPEPS